MFCAADHLSELCSRGPGGARRDSLTQGGRDLIDRDVAAATGAQPPNAQPPNGQLNPAQAVVGNAQAVNAMLAQAGLGPQFGNMAANLIAQMQNMQMGLAGPQPLPPATPPVGQVANAQPLMLGMNAQPPLAQDRQSGQRAARRPL